MSDNPQITIAVCTRNRAEVLAEVCAALQQQSVPPENFAVIVVNNGSTDGTAALLQKQRPHFPHFLEVFETELGSSLARNRAAEHCATPWIAFLDDDSLPDADYVEKALARTQTSPHACLAGETRAWRRGPLPDWFLDEYEDFVMSNKNSTQLESGEYAFGNNMLVRVDALRKVDGFDPRLGVAGSVFCFGEETDVQIRLQQAGYSLGYAPDARIAHFAKPERYTLSNVLRVCYRKTLVLLVLQNRGSWSEALHCVLKFGWCPLRNLATGVARMRQGRWSWKNALIHVAEGFCAAAGSLAGWLWLRRNGPWRYK